MHRQLSWQWTLVWVCIFSIAMAYLEGAVVVYLRTIYYPYGFDFPLAPIDKPIAITEIGREAATLLMLLSIGLIAGKTRLQRFAYFLYSFAIWDIFYYIFLYLLIGWPKSLLTWDVLFLIPVTWVGPVVAPVILSLTMIFLGLLIIIREERQKYIRLGPLSWILLIIGSLILVVSFTWDYTSYLLQYFSFDELFKTQDNPARNDLAYKFIPTKFNWFLFIAGEFIVLCGIAATTRKLKLKKRQK